MGANGPQPIGYEDVPAVTDFGRWVDSEGAVHVGEAGAPVLPAKLLSEADARQALTDAGVPAVIQSILNANDSLREIASILPKGAKMSGEPGAEAIGIAVPGGKNWRIQYGKTEAPLNSYDIGKYGVYPEWQKKYGKIYVQQKEQIPTLAKDFGSYSTIDSYGQKLTAGVQATNPNISWDFYDLHTGNWGKDAKGRLRIFDPGAAVPWGKDILR
jgi:hypothetical protein